MRRIGQSFEQNSNNQALNVIQPSNNLSVSQTSRQDLTRNEPLLCRLWAHRPQPRYSAAPCAGAALGTARDNQTTPPAHQVDQFFGDNYKKFLSEILTRLNGWTGMHFFNHIDLCVRTVRIAPMHGLQVDDKTPRHYRLDLPRIWPWSDENKIIMIQKQE